MEKLHDAYLYFVAHWDTISAVVSFIGLNIANLLMRRHPDAAGELRDFINKVSVTTSAEFPAWKLKFPLSNGPAGAVSVKVSLPPTAEKTIPADIPVPTIPPTAAIVFLGICLSLSACMAHGFCADKKNVSTPTCIAERDAIACGMDAVKILPALFPFVLVQDWQGLIASVEAALPPAAADCILGILDPQIAAKYGAGSQGYLAFHQRYQLFRVKIGFVK